MSAPAARLRWLSVGVFVVLVAVAITVFFVARQVVHDDARQLLQKQTGEVSALLTNSFTGVDASLRSLSAVADPSDPTARAFVQSARPLVVGQTRAVVLLQLDAGAVRRVAIVGDGVPDGEFEGDRAELVRRASRQPGLVTAVIRDGSRRRIGLARGPWPQESGWIVYQESAIDPSNADQPTSGRPFRELDVAVYASSTPRDDQLVIATGKDVPLEGEVATAPVSVGVDHWLVVAASPHPLVGDFAARMPWILLVVGLATALLAAVVVEVVSRRRDFALALVEERTAKLQATVKELQLAQNELLRHAFNDGLTGLPNRALFLDRLNNAIERARRGAAPPVVVFLDVDRFKWVNDSLGHDAGDEFLIAIARRLAAAVRPGDTVARFGGDEFVILCDGVDAHTQLPVLAQRLQEAVGRPLLVHGREVHPTVSVGIVASRPDEDKTAEELVRDADLAMYRAKELGRNRIEVFDEPLRRSAIARLERESALRAALENEEFVAHYQPVVDLLDGSVVGVEALLRWYTPQGIITPDEFIPLAEDTGLIEPLGARVLTSACTQLAAWNSDRAAAGLRPLRLSVNVSTRQLVGSHLRGLVEATLADCGLEPSLLCLEITESTLIDASGARAALDELKALGATVVVDDFGTGYSSLIYLRQFPVDELKVDKSFVAGLGRDIEDTAIVSGVVSLAKALGLRTVAEGVETLDQARLLAAMGCELAQGYYWTPPMSARDFHVWLSHFEERSVPPVAQVSSASAQNASTR